MLLNRFLHQCQLQPDAPALHEQQRQMSFRQLLERAHSLAGALHAHGIRPDQPVAIYLDRGIDAVIALFGTLLAGACYVPLDLKNPWSRLAFIIADARAQAVLGKGSKPDWLEHDLWLDIDAFIPTDDGGMLHTEALVDKDAQQQSLAAILYTSGSTGQPRGVAISHGAIAAFADWASELLTLTPDDRIASSAPFFFDLSTFDLYAVLGSGASLHFIPASLFMAPARLSAWLKEQCISGWYTVPSLLSFLAYKGNLTDTALDDLRFLIFAGEVFPTPALIHLAGSLPRTALYNFFGPTETNVCCYWPVARDRLDFKQSIPIGRAAAGCRLHIDDNSGELLVQGPTLASGYWRDGAIQPFLNDQGWYATGDSTSLQQGEYHFHGRLGRMLKCSGYRVEPAEIEAVVSVIVGVVACAVIGMTDPTAGQRPALAVVLKPETNLAEIRKVLAASLPAYMQPSRYLELQELPRLANGKLDYRQLKLQFEDAG